jgi:hypothetical protein
MIHRILTAVCAFRVYRGPEQAIWLDAGKGDGTLRQQTIGECAATAVTEGKVLADELVKVLKS